MWSISTIGECIKHRHAISVSCNNPNCGRWRVLDLKALGVRLGWDHSTLHDELILRLKCPGCGGKNLQMTLHAPTIRDPASGEVANPMLNLDGTVRGPR